MNFIIYTGAIISLLMILIWSWIVKHVVCFNMRSTEKPLIIALMCSNDECNIITGDGLLNHDTMLAKQKLVISQ